MNLVGPGIGWVVTDRAILVTNDDGRTWRDVTPDGVTVADVIAMKAASPLTTGLGAVDGQTAYVATDEVGVTTTEIRIWRTSDGGRTWHWTSPLSIPKETPNDCGCLGHTSLIDAVDSLDVIVDVAEHAGTDSVTNTIFRSLDGGLTWNSMPLSVGPDGSGAEARIHFLTADIGTVSFDTEVFMTNSGWGQWTAFAEAGKVGYAHGPLTFLDARHWIVAGQPDLHLAVPIAESFDAGRTWTVRSQAVRLTSGVSAVSDFNLVFIDAATWVALVNRPSDPAFAPGPTETWMSTNAGTTWSFAGYQPTLDPRGSVFVDRLHAWVIDTASGLSATDDGGATWTQIGP